MQEHEPRRDHGESDMHWPVQDSIFIMGGIKATKVTLMKGGGTCDSVPALPQSEL